MKKVKLGSVLAALVMFAFPWLDIQCSGKSMVTQTGFQVIIGDASPNPQMEAIIKKGAEAFGGRGEKEAFGDEGKKKESSSSDKSLGLAPLVALALIAVIGALVFSFIAVFRDSARSERVTSVLSASALLLLLVQLLIGFPAKRGLDEAMKKNSSDSQAGDDGFWAEMEIIQVNKTPVFYLELLALGIPTLLLLRNRSKDAKPVTGPTKALHTECQSSPFADAENIEPRTKEIVVPAPVAREKAPLTPAPKRKGASRLVAGLLAGASGGVVCGSIVLIGMVKINETTNDKQTDLTATQSDASALLVSSNRELTSQVAEYRTAAQLAENLQRQLDLANNEVARLRKTLDLKNQDTIPAAFHGLWLTPYLADQLPPVGSKNDLDEFLGERDGGWMEINQEGIRLHESFAAVFNVEVSEQGREIDCRTNVSGEGEEWKANYFYRISPDGKTLTDRAYGETVYYKVVFQEEVLEQARESQDNDPTSATVAQTIPAVFHGKHDLGFIFEIAATSIKNYDRDKYMVSNVEFMDEGRVCVVSAKSTTKQDVITLRQTSNGEIWISSRQLDDALPSNRLESNYKRQTELLKSQLLKSPEARDYLERQGRQPMPSAGELLNDLKF